MARTVEEIDHLLISTLTTPVSVSIKYKDGKRANFGVDRGKLNELELLDEIKRAVLLQMASVQGGGDGTAK